MTVKEISVMSAVAAQARLSVGKLLDQLKKKEFTEFSASVSNHFSLHDNDYESALKVSKVTGNFSFENTFDSQTVEEVGRNIVMAVEILLGSHPELTDTLLHELFYNTYCFMSKLAQQKFTHVISQSWRVLMKILERVNQKKLLYGTVYKQYVIMWNLFNVERQVKDIPKDDFLMLLDIGKGGIIFYMFLENYSQFVVDKCIDRVITFGRTIATSKHSDTKIIKQLLELLTLISSRNLMKTDSEVLKMAIFTFELFFVHFKDLLEESLSSFKDSRSSVYFDFFIAIAYGKSILKDQFMLDLNFDHKSMSLLLQPCLSTISSFSSSIVTSDPSTLVNICESLLPFLVKCQPSNHLARIFHRLGVLLSSLYKNVSKIDARTQSLTVKIFTESLESVKGIGLDASTKPYWSQFSMVSHSIANYMVASELDLDRYEEMMQLSIDCCEMMMTLDESMRQSLRLRWKHRADVNFLKRKNYKFSLKCLASATDCLLQEEDQEKVPAILQDYSMLWLRAKAEIIKTEPDEVHNISLLTLCENEDMGLRLKMAKIECSWYRYLYSSLIE